jgi:transposase
MRRIRDILRLKYEARLPHRDIARACALGVGTVSSYLQRAAQAGLSWPLPAQLDDAGLEAQLFRQPAPPGGPRPTPDWAHLHQELKRTGVTLQLLWLEYLAVHPEGYRYSQFCEHYRRWARKLNPSMRQRHRPGEKLFVDYSGKGLEYINRHTGEIVPVELFVAVLGASSYTYAEATASQQLACWIDTHIHTVEYLGGSAAVYVSDNLKSGVTTPCRYEPRINRSYEDLASHYGAVVIPARSGKPKDKAKVETGVLVAQRWLLARLRDRQFFSLAEINAALRELLVELNDRPMRRLGVSRRQLFEQLDRPALKPLPAERYQLREWKEARVSIDYHVAFDHNYYSVPHQLLHEKLEVCYSAAAVEIYQRDRRITSHRRLFGRGLSSTYAEHMPSSHRAHAEWTPSRIIRWAERSGAATGRVVAEILRARPHPEQGYRSCLGLLRLGKRYGEARLEAACCRAEGLKSYSYRTIKNMLASGFDQIALEPSDSRAVTPVHENIRGASHYATDPTEPEQHPC